MARHANTTLIGSFIIGAVILGVGATLLLSGGLLSSKGHFVMFFTSSVKGLSVGAPVNFRGVKIGTVTDIRLLLEPMTQRVQIPVYVDLEEDRVTLIKGEDKVTHKIRSMGDMIRHGLRAQLQMQSLLTGQLAVQLDIHPDKPAILMGTTEDLIEIPTIPTPLQEFTSKLEEFPFDQLLEDLARATQGIDKLVNGPELPQAIKQLDQTMKDYSALAHQYGAIATELKLTLSETRTTLHATQSLIGTGEQLAEDSSGLVQQLRLNADRLTASAEGALGAIKTTADNSNALLSPDAQLQYQLMQTLKEIASSAQALRQLTNTLEQHPEVLIQGKTKEEQR
ncbi:MAG: MlaD family protein [Gammaproteobacteria bacterium]|nr:MlaD family protein [Gammaproteobacteria bacterium]